MAASISTKVRYLITASTVGLIASFSTVLEAKATALSSASGTIQPRLATFASPENYLTSGFDGVAQLVNNSFGFCNGSLLNTGLHVLTAAHCLDEQSDPLNINVNFDDDISIGTSNFFIYPEYDSLQSFNDIAIIELASEAPANISRYDIYRNSDEVGRVGQKVGTGAFGTGSTGVGTSPEFFDDQRRTGQNRYDALGEIINGIIPSLEPIPPGTQLAYDFDSGLPENDAFGLVFGEQYADLGLGVNEVNSALGDSGSPTFIDGLIAGVTSYGFGADFSSNLLASDLTPLTDSSFGEISVDTRVSFYASWIDNILGIFEGEDGGVGEGEVEVEIGVGETPTSIPQSTTVSGLMVLGTGLLLKRKKQN